MTKESKKAWRKVTDKFASKEITEAVRVLKSYYPDSYMNMPGKKRAELVMRYLSAQRNIHKYLDYTTNEEVVEV